MRWKTTTILLAVTIGIGAYVSLYELKQPLPEERERRSKDLLNIPSESVTQLVLDLPNAKVTLTREGSSWKLAPQNVRADPDRIGQILNSASALSAERILSGTAQRPPDLKAFGLDPALGWMTLVANGTPTTVLVGDTTPVQAHRYIKVSNRPEVFVIPSALVESMDQPSDTFRDPLFIRFDSWLADQLTVAAPTSTLSLARQDNEWRVTQPVADQADRSEINALLSSLGGIRIQRFVDDAPRVEQLAAWGFDHPKAEVTLRLRGEPSVSTTLFFGKPLADHAAWVYAKRSDEPSLYAVSAADVDALLKDPNTLRAKACFAFFTSSVTKLEVAKPGTSWTIERKDHQWQEAESHAGLQAERVEAFLNKLSDLRLSGFVEEAPSDLSRYGLQSPDGTITVWTGNPDKPQKLLVGSPLEGSKDHYGRMEGRNAIIQLPEMIDGLLATTLEQLRPPAPTPSPSTPKPPQHQTPSR